MSCVHQCSGCCQLCTICPHIRVKCLTLQCTVLCPGISQSSHSVPCLWMQQSQPWLVLNQCLDCLQKKHIVSASGLNLGHRKTLQIHMHMFRPARINMCPGACLQSCPLSPSLCVCLGACLQSCSLSLSFCVDMYYLMRCEVSH